MARDDWTQRSGWLLPSVALQVLLHRLADTDLQGQLAYQDRIAAFHAQLRRFFYPYIFNDKAFGPAEFARLPAWRAGTPEGGVSVAAFSALGLLAAAGLAAGASRLRRVQAL